MYSVLRKWWRRVGVLVSMCCEGLSRCLLLDQRGAQLSMPTVCGKINNSLVTHVSFYVFCVCMCACMYFMSVLCISIFKFHSRRKVTGPRLRLHWLLTIVCTACERLTLPSSFFPYFPVALPYKHLTANSNLLHGQQRWFRKTCAQHSSQFATTSSLGEKLLRPAGWTLH